MRPVLRSFGRSVGARTPHLGGQVRRHELHAGTARYYAASSSPRFAARKEGFVEKILNRYREPPPPSPQVARLTASTKLLAEPDVTSEVVEDLATGELVETFADLEDDTEWVLVRSPLEDRIDIMSDKPLEYQDGWLHNPQLELSEFQVGDKVAARQEVLEHPVLQIMRCIPPWKSGTPLPTLMLEAVSEFHAGKIGGVTKKARFLVQRPSGAMPERIATYAEMLFVPRRRKKRTFVSALVGLLGASLLGTLYHMWKWMKGRSMDQGRFAWVNLVSYITLVAVFMTPLCYWPCYIFSISHLSTASSICFLNMLLYFDLFSE